MIVANSMLCSATEPTQYTALFMALRLTTKLQPSEDSGKYCCLSVTVHEEVGSSDEKGLEAPRRFTVAWHSAAKFRTLDHLTIKLQPSEDLGKSFAVCLSLSTKKWEVRMRKASRLQEDLPLL